jgi:hypothetical protein
MNILNIEAADAKDCQEISDWILNEVHEKVFQNEEEFYDMESEMIVKAAKALNWAFVPDSLVLVVEWEN